ncbi:MAG: hypothetical protein M0Z30_19185 [Actinomycetota bacterium]|nr:hypothetical protein [Actinomycetota bacterium]
MLAEVAVCGPFWPGIVQWDNAEILAEAHHGPIVDWWTALGTLAIRGWFDLGLGQGALWALLVAATIVGLFGCLRMVLRPPQAAVAALAVTVFPPVYGQLSSLSRDTAFLAFSLLAFAALGVVVRRGATRRGRWLTVAMACSVLATVSRQNGLVDVTVVVLFGGLHGRTISWRRVAASGGAGLVAALAGFGLISAAGSALGARALHPERATYVYDLAALSVSTGRDLFPQAQLRQLGPGGQAPPDVSLPTLRARFASFNLTTVTSGAALDYTNVALAEREDAILRAAWEKAVTGHPAAYLAERARLTLDLVGLGNRGPDAGGYGGDFAYQPPTFVTNFGDPLTFPFAASVAGDVMGWFIGPGALLPLDLLWTYLVAGVAATVVLWRRRQSSRVWAVCLLSGLLLNLVVLFFTSMAAGYRYANAIPPVVVLLVLFALATRPGEPDAPPAPVDDREAVLAG